MQKKHEAATRANFLLDTMSNGRLDIDWTRYLAYLGVDSTREFATWNGVKMNVGDSRSDGVRSDSFSNFPK